jgi:hypothetical protein
VAFAPSNVWRRSMQIIDSNWRPRRDLNPCYRRESASERILTTLTSTLSAPQLSAIMVRQTNFVVVHEVDKNKATGGQGQRGLAGRATSVSETCFGGLVLSPRSCLSRSADASQFSTNMPSMSDYSDLA